MLRPARLLLAVLALAAPAVQAQDVVFTSFDDLDLNNYDVVSATGAGVEIGFRTFSTPDENQNGIAVFVEPAQVGAFAGATVRTGAGAFDAGGADSVVVRFAARRDDDGDLPAEGAVVLREDADGDGTFDGATDDAVSASFAFPEGDGAFEVVLPLSAFADDDTFGAGAGDGFDFERVLEVVVVARPGGGAAEFVLVLDEVAFRAGTATSAEAPPSAFAAAPLAFPNPTAGGAAVAFGLAAPSAVAVEVLDVLGRRVAALDAGAYPAGPVRLAVPTAGLAPGLYVVLVRTEGGAASARLVVTR